VDAWTDYADCLFETNDLNTAGMAYIRVLNLKPELYKLFKDDGKIPLILNLIKQAKNEFIIPHNSAKNCPEPLNNLADVHFKSGKFEKSIMKYKKLLEINYNLANACFMLGMAYIKIIVYQSLTQLVTESNHTRSRKCIFLRKF